jgi:hypothetical protein
MLDDAASRVELIKIDTEGAEVQILEGLLPYVRKGLVGAIVVELMPHAWERRGASDARALSALRGLTQHATGTYLLYDPTPWGFPTTAAVENLSYVTGRTFKDFEWQLLVTDRKQKVAGCNAYFTFT